MVAISVEKTIRSLCYGVMYFFDSCCSKRRPVLRPVYIGSLGGSLIDLDSG